MPILSDLPSPISVFETDNTFAAYTLGEASRADKHVLDYTFVRADVLSEGDDMSLRGYMLSVGQHEIDNVLAFTHLSQLEALELRFDSGPDEEAQQRHELLKQLPNLRVLIIAGGMFNLSDMLDCVPDLQYCNVVHGSPATHFSRCPHLLELAVPNQTPHILEKLSLPRLQAMAFKLGSNEAFVQKQANFINEQRFEQLKHVCITEVNLYTNAFLRALEVPDSLCSLKLNTASVGLLNAGLAGMRDKLKTLSHLSFYSGNFESSRCVQLNPDIDLWGLRYLRLDAAELLPYSNGILAAPQLQLLDLSIAMLERNLQAPSTLRSMIQENSQVTLPDGLHVKFSDGLYRYENKGFFAV